MTDSYTVLSVGLHDYFEKLECSQFLKSQCCDVPLAQIKDFMLDVKYTYCVKCYSIVGVFTGEDEWMMKSDHHWENRRY